MVSTPVRSAGFGRAKELLGERNLEEQVELMLASLVLFVLVQWVGTAHEYVSSDPRDLPVADHLQLSKAVEGCGVGQRMYPTTHPYSLQHGMAIHLDVFRAIG